MLLLATSCLLAACGGADRTGFLTPPQVDGAEQGDPALAIDSATGDVLLAWLAGDSTGYAIWFTRSSDTGATWTEPVRIAGQAADIKPHGESSPRLVAGPGRIAIAWSNSVPAPGRRWPASNMRVAHSRDGGRTWSAAVTINDDTSSSSGGGHLFHGAAWEGDSALVVAWMDTRSAHHTPVGEEEADATIYTARSADFGATWESSNRARWAAACPCCRVSLARQSDGQLIAAWRQHFPGNVRDIVAASLNDSAPVRVSGDDWVVAGCPHTGPGLATSPGRTHVAWYTGKPGAAGIYYEASDRNAYGEPVALVSAASLPVAHPAVAAGADGSALVVWNLAGDGSRAPHFARIDREGAVRDRRRLAATQAEHPQIVAVPGGALVAWTELDGGRNRIRLMKVAL